MEQKIQTYLHAQIPLSKAMGITIERASAEKVRLKAPLLPNINHKKTVFGGSLHAAATLACWTLLYVKLQEIGVHASQLVITKSHTEYLAPVSGDFLAEAPAPSEQAWLRFLSALQSKRKARIELKASILYGEKVCVGYHATFAALTAIRTPLV